MTYQTGEAREDLLDTLASATDEIGIALAALGEAYEQLDEHASDRLEEQLFRPVQSAYGRARRTHAEFAERHRIDARTFDDQRAGGRPNDPRGAIEHAVEAARAADETLAQLQDSMLPVEVGDPPLRAGLSEVRQLIGPVPGRAREFVRTLGR